jgi:predicted outer membrane lipoprotein
MAFLVLALLVIPTVALLMISTGERTPVILFLVGGTYAAMRCAEWGFQSRRAVTALLVLMALVVLSAFYSLTSSFTSREYGDTSTVAILLDRVVTRMPEENVVGAPVWSLGAPFPGAGWLLEIASVLPGPQATLSNLIHEHIGGGDRGNSVLGMWVDVYYNFGWLLGVPIALLLGVVSAFFNHWVNKLRSESSTAEICGLWLSVCMLFVFSPFGFLLYGPFVLSAFLLFASFLLPRAGADRVSANARVAKGPTSGTAALAG